MNAVSLDKGINVLLAELSGDMFNMSLNIAEALQIWVELATLEQTPQGKLTPKYMEKARDFQQMVMAILKEYSTGTTPIDILTEVAKRLEAKYGPIS